jgi:sugar O-acyltransferase (sialic acid O-acetyltransferase NeuD family)
LIKLSFVLDKPCLLIVGAGGHGRSVADSVLLLDEYHLVGFIDDGAFLRGENVWDFPVIGPAAGFADYKEIASHVIVAIGSNSLRQRLSFELTEAGFVLPSLIHPRATVSSRAVLGAGTVVMAGAVVGTEASLGLGVIVNSGAVVDHHAQVHDFAHLGVNASMAGGSVLGACSWLQAGTAIGYGVKVARDTVLSVGD